MPPVITKRANVDSGEMSGDEEDGPTTAKKRMLEQRLSSLTVDQMFPKKTATGIIAVKRNPSHDSYDPPDKPFTAAVQTVSLVVSDSMSQRSQRTSQSSDGSVRVNFKSFVRKGQKMSGHSPQSSQVLFVECRLKSFDRSEYQVMIALSFPISM